MNKTLRTVSASLLAGFTVLTLAAAGAAMAGPKFTTEIDKAGQRDQAEYYRGLAGGNSITMDAQAGVGQSSVTDMAISVSSVVNVKAEEAARDAQADISALERSTASRIAALESRLASAGSASAPATSTETSRLGYSKGNGTYGCIKEGRKGGCDQRGIVYQYRGCKEITSKVNGSVTGVRFAPTTGWSYSRSGLPNIQMGGCTA
jgi:hypothetical protein